MRRSQFALLLPFLLSFLFIALGFNRQDIPDLSGLFKKSEEISNSNEATVVSVTDGDTFRAIVNGQEKPIRLIGINTPEISRPVECFGQEAKQKLNELIGNKTVRIEKDVNETDRYGRLLRYVYVGDQFVNENMVAQGYATAATFPPDVKYQQTFISAEQFARSSNLGLWSTCQ